MDKKRKIIISIAAISFIVILVCLCLNKVYGVDKKVYDIIISMKSDSTTKFFKLITELGGVVFTLILCVASLILFKEKGKYFCLNVVIVVLLNNIVKFIVARPRPDGFRLIKESGYSFPSGHSMNSCAIYGLFAYMVYKSNLNKYVKILLMSLLGLVIILVPVSRVYLGVHYFTDVLAGFFLSVIWLMIYTKYLTKKGIF